MKFKLLLSAVALTLFAAGCSNDENELMPGNGEPGSLAITIAGENVPTSRATETGTTADDEKKVHNFTVYVFDESSNNLEKVQKFIGTTTGRISGLSTGNNKKVVVFVNVPDDNQIAANNYNELNTNSISLARQNFSNGLFMSGEQANIQLTSDGVTSVTITVRRLAAKVKFGKLVVDPATGHDLGKFEMKGVSIQKARDAASPMGDGLMGSGFNYIGGIKRGMPTFEVDTDYLYDTYSLPSNYAAGSEVTPEKYFYVFPNTNNINQEATMMTLYATYNGIDMYFPFYVNNKQATDPGSTTDGEYIKRNKVYTINVTLKQIGHGSPDPETTNASLDVKVDVADWEDELIQNVEW